MVIIDSWKMLLQHLWYHYYWILIEITSNYVAIWASHVAQWVKNLPVMQETQTQSLVQEDSLEDGMATHSNVLAWRSPWTAEPGRGYSSWGHKESDTAEVTEHTCSYLEVRLRLVFVYMLWLGELKYERLEASKIVKCPFLLLRISCKTP